MKTLIPILLIAILLIAFISLGFIIIDPTNLPN